VGEAGEEGEAGAADDAAGAEEGETREMNVLAAVLLADDMVTIARHAAGQRAGGYRLLPQYAAERRVRVLVCRGYRQCWFLGSSQCPKPVVCTLAG
jgi:hypothetical protein